MRAETAAERAVFAVKEFDVSANKTIFQRLNDISYMRINCYHTSYVKVPAACMMTPVHGLTIEIILRRNSRIYEEIQLFFIGQ
jgi:hypothetical protein